MLKVIVGRLSLLLFKLISYCFGYNKGPISMSLYPPQLKDPADTPWPNDPRARAALRVLRRELARFPIRALKVLRRLISKGFVPGTEWNDNSILSFRNGFHNSAVRDSRGRKRNAFTIYYKKHRRALLPEIVLYEIKAKIPLL